MTKNGNPELVNLTIDGKPVSVPKGTNLIEAAKTIGVEIPYYCYHPHLSIAGNCRMCQVKVKGAPKLEIGCNTLVREGMEVSTHESSKEVEDAQAATLEFILINHPLDCTVCDQAGHCKLQDYHYEYNAKSSRFLEDKEHKVKAEPLGPTVMLDGERCIMCTRCVRFCDEVTKTSELGMLNRGDKSVIAINPSHPLNNALSGTVVDLCPVGALTHKHWRFNTRIWFTKQTDTICPGCSTGCNSKVAERDGQVVQVKARLNSAVNKEWMCDEGRYGFDRFLPENRVLEPRVSGEKVSWELALKEAKSILAPKGLVFVSPDLMLEEYYLLKTFLDSYLKESRVVVAYRERALTPQEAILISPDYAANFRGAEFAGLVSGNLETSYKEALNQIKEGGCSSLFFVGERAVNSQDVTDDFCNSVSKIGKSVSVMTDAGNNLSKACKVVLPGRSILEKSGLMINRAKRLQYAERCIDFPESSQPEWRILNNLASHFGKKLVESVNDRDLSIHYLRNESRLKELKIAQIKDDGVPLE